MQEKVTSVVRVCSMLIVCGSFIASCVFEKRGVAEQVCSIYEDMRAYSDFSVSEREGILTEQIQKQLPTFFDQNFQYFMSVDWKEKPATMEKLLRLVEEDHSLKLCEPVRDYYTVP